MLVQTNRGVGIVFDALKAMGEAEQGHHVGFWEREPFLAIAPLMAPSQSDDLSVRRLNAVAALLGGWVWETNAEHRFTYLSDSVEAFTGQKPEAFVGKTRAEIGQAKYRTEGIDNWQKQLERRTAFGPADFILHRDGKSLVMRTIGHPQFDASGAFAGYVGIAFRVMEAPDVKDEERRGEPRRRTVRAAEVTVPGTDTVVMCVLADISKSGARLQLPDDVALPRQFRLKVEGLGLDKSCRMRWRRGTSLGLEFAD
ncbi:MAG: PilZ domain-containing protein [Hyphomicrobiaceae bacterium]